MVDDDGGGGLFGDELEFFRERHADFLGRQKLKELHVVFQARTGGVAEAVAGAAVALPENFLAGRTVFLLKS